MPLLGNLKISKSILVFVTVRVSAGSRIHQMVQIRNFNEGITHKAERAGRISKGGGTRTVRQGYNVPGAWWLLKP